MRRFFFGLLWFIAIWIGSLMLGGIIYSSVDNAINPPPEISASTFSEGYSQGYEQGRVAGRKFGRRFGGLIFLGALGASIFLTYRGVLPGTKKKEAPSPIQPNVQ